MMYIEVGESQKGLKLKGWLIPPCRSYYLLTRQSLRPLSVPSVLPCGETVSAARTRALGLILPSHLTLLQMVAESSSSPALPPRALSHCWGVFPSCHPVERVLPNCLPNLPFLQSVLLVAEAEYLSFPHAYTPCVAWCTGAKTVCLRQASALVSRTVSGTQCELSKRASFFSHQTLNSLGANASLTFKISGAWHDTCITEYLSSG